MAKIKLSELADSVSNSMKNKKWALITFKGRMEYEESITYFKTVPVANGDCAEATLETVIDAVTIAGAAEKAKLYLELGNPCWMFDELEGIEEGGKNGMSETYGVNFSELMSGDIELVNGSGLLEAYAFTVNIHSDAVDQTCVCECLLVDITDIDMD